MKTLWRISVICAVLAGSWAASARADNLEAARRMLDERLLKLRMAREARVGLDRRTFAWPGPDTIEGEWKEGILRPGEPFTFEGVTARWVIPDATETMDDLLGWLSFAGPSGSIDIVPVPAVWEEQTDRRTGQTTQYVQADGNIGVYLDDVIFTDIRMAWPRGSGSLAEFLAGGLKLQAGRQPNRLDIGGGPQDLSLYVSSLTPVTINETQIAISDRPVEEVAGEMFYELTLRNLKTGEAETDPLILDLRRTFGRFSVVVRTFDPASGTAALGIEARKDLTVRGRDAYIEEFRVESEFLGEWLEHLGSQYGFQVEWVPESGFPDSVDYMRSVRAPFGARITNETVERLVQGIFSREWALEYQWINGTHLRVSPANYDQVVAEREKEARMEQAREEMSEVFEKDYSLETKVYVLRKMKASTAKELVDGLLSVFYLQLTDRPLPVARSACSRQDGREAGSIWACRKDALEILPEKAREDHDKFVQMAAGSAGESVVADEMSNSIIVTAVPQTHKRIQSLIEKMEGLVDDRGPAGAVERYRVAVVLLSGGQTGTESDTELSFPIGGVVEEIPAKIGQRVEAGDVLARLNSDDAALRSKELKAMLDGARAQHGTAKKEWDRLKLMFEKGMCSQKEVRDAELGLLELEAIIQVKEVQIEQVQRQTEKSALQSPDTGTVISVHARPNQKIDAGDTVVVLRKERVGSASPPGPPTESHPAAIQGRNHTEELMEKYGLAAGDLEAFGLETLRELGRGVVSLAAERGETGKARVSLTSEYACELDFQDVREPYVIVRGRLLAEDREQPLIENTLYLEEDTPSMLGVTNLREGLILVVRRGE